jgi:hypothetical protein
MASFLNRTVVEPTRAETDAMVTILDVMAWAQLDGDAAIGLLTALGGDVSSDITAVASIDTIDFNDALVVWRIGEDTPRPPSPMEKGKVCCICAEGHWRAGLS